MCGRLDVSVIICAYTEDRWDDLVAAVESVLRQSTPPREIIVVIDHNPRLLERVRAYFRGVIAVENKGLRGASGSKNTGVAAATGRVVAFLDDDAAVAPDWLEQLVVEFDNPNVVGVGGMTAPRWTGKKPKWFPEEFYWVVGCTHRGMPETTAPVRNLIACNMTVRRQVFDEIGGFRSGIGPMGGHALGCEETEFCIRLSQRCRQKMWLHKPQARAYHHVPAGRANWRYFVRRCYGEGRSKALVVRFVGTEDGLVSERTHTLRTLPRGVARGLADTVLRGDLAGFARACAIVVGLAIAMLGYLTGLLLTWHGSKDK
jgi:glycosyltransferase involved in cell wall biosynthesis